MNSMPNFVTLLISHIFVSHSVTLLCAQEMSSAIVTFNNIITVPKETYDFIFLIFFCFIINLLHRI